MFQSANGSLSADTITTILRDAGISENSPLERQIIPEVVRRRDLLVEADSSERKGTPLLLPLLACPGKAPGAVNSMLLTTDRTMLTQAEHSFRRLSGRHFKGRNLIVLGREMQARKELRLISKRPSTIVGTPERIIDHLRRGNLDLSRLETIVFDVPDAEGRESFEQDAEFITSKIPNHPVSTVYALEPEKLSFLQGFQRRPALLSRQMRGAFVPCLYTFPCNQDLTEGTVRVLLDRGPVEHCLVVGRSMSDLGRLKEHLKQYQVHVSTLQEGPEAGRAGCFLTAPGDAAPLPPGIRTLLFSGCIPEEQELSRIMKETLENPKETTFLLVYTPGDVAETGAKQLEEKQQMNIEEKTMPKDEDVLKGYIANMLHSIKVDEDPEVLNAYRKMVRKHVPFFMRSYFSAYLLKQSGAKLPGGTENRPRRKKGAEKAGETPDMKTLFVSIGKNRRVYPKDLVQLFRSTLNLEKEEVGAVKVLDNYSFVEISSTRADDAISRLDGTEFRGRTITVNHARKK